MSSPLVLVVGVVTVVLLLSLSAFFSSTEMAVFSVSREWVAERAATGDRSAQTLQALNEDPHRLLVTILVGNNVVNIAVSSIVTVLVANYLTAGLAVAATTVLTSLLVLIFGEIVPKAYGLANARQWSLTVAAPVRFVERILSPVITLFDEVTRRMSALIPVDPDIEKPYVDR